jgi:hypothetical protein
VPRRQVTKAASVDTGLPFECGFCAKGFLTSHDLALHVDTMHGATTKACIERQLIRTGQCCTMNSHHQTTIMIRRPAAYDRVPEEQRINDFDSARF